MRACATSTAPLVLSLLSRSHRSGLQRKSAKFKVEAEQHRTAAAEAQARAASAAHPAVHLGGAALQVCVGAQALAASRASSVSEPALSAPPSEELGRAASAGVSKAEAALGPLQLELSEQRELATTRLEEVPTSPHSPRLCPPCWNTGYPQYPSN